MTVRCAVTVEGRVRRCKVGVLYAFNLKLKLPQ